MAKWLTCLCILLFLASCNPKPTVTAIPTAPPSSTVAGSPTSPPILTATPVKGRTVTQTSIPTQERTATTAPTKTFTPAPPTIVASCPGAPDILLNKGAWAQVSLDPPVPNKVRSQPNKSGELIGWVQPGENVEVVDGPRCADGYTWWFVRNLSGLEGWTVEGDSSGYWLVNPIYAWYHLPKPLISAGLKTYDLRELKISADQALVSNINGSYNPLATPMPRPQNLNTPEPDDPRYSDFGTASYAAHSFYTVSGVVEDSWVWVYDLTDPLSRYYLNHKKYNDCTKVLRDNLDAAEILKDYLNPFCGVNGGIPLLFKAGVKRIQFTGGEGVRFLIASGNYQTVNSLTYHFQGLSDDGRYFIHGLLRPIFHPYMLEDQLYKGDFGWLLEWREGQYEQAQKSYDLFNSHIEALLNADKITLYPSLDFLDQMMISIVIK
jgi:hypothetical protein